MANPTFYIKCKIDGEDHVVAVKTHGSNSVHPLVPIIRTPEQALAFVREESEKHKVHDGDGKYHFAAHIDAEGNEHYVTDIGECSTTPPEKIRRATAPAAPSAADVAKLAGK